MTKAESDDNPSGIIYWTSPKDEKCTLAYKDLKPSVYVPFLTEPENDVS